MLGRVPVALTAALALTLILVVAAFAQTGGGFLNGDGLGVGVGTPGGSGSGGGGTGSTGGGGGGGGSVPVCTAPGGSGPVGYTVVSADVAATLNVAGPRVDELMPGRGILVGKTQPAPTINNPNPEPERGTWYVKTCGGNQAGYVWAPEGTTPGPPPPPPPPTAEEMFDLVPIPTPAWGVSPQGDGLTGLQTWLWDTNGAGSRTVTATIRGWTATATASPNRWQWTMYEPGQPAPAGSRSNPPAAVSATSPGSQAAPATEFRYETPGEYTLTLRVTWTGSYTYTRPGFSPTTSPLGSSTREATRGYTVASISPVIVASRA